MIRPNRQLLSIQAMVRCNQLRSQLGRQVMT